MRQRRRHILHAVLYLRSSVRRGTHDERGFAGAVARKQRNGRRTTSKKIAPGMRAVAYSAWPSRPTAGMYQEASSTWGERGRAHATMRQRVTQTPPRRRNSAVRPGTRLQAGLAQARLQPVAGDERRLMHCHCSYSAAACSGAGTHATARRGTQLRRQADRCAQHAPRSVALVCAPLQVLPLAAR